MIITTVSDLLHENDLAVVFFTKGDQFKYDAIGNGETGDWLVDSDVVKDVNKVVIYLRDENIHQNRIFIGSYKGFRKGPRPGRYTLKFSNLTEVGVTASNWNEFAKSGQNPVSYAGEFV